MKKQPEQMPEDQRFHDTYLLLKKYRDVVWGLELSVQQVKRRFQMEVGSSIEDFLESIYLAGVDFSDNGIEEQARSIEKSYQMLKLLEVSVNIMRNKHKHGEMYYWLLYYSYLSPQQYRSVDEIIEMIRPHVSDISERTFFRRRKNAVEALSSILWGYTSRDSLSLMEQFFPDKLRWQQIGGQWQYIGSVLLLWRKSVCAIMCMLKTVSSADKGKTDTIFSMVFFCCPD